MGIGSYGAVDGFDGFGVEVSRKDEGSGSAVLTDELKEVLALLVAQGGKKGAISRLQMCRGDAYFLSSFFYFEDHQQGYL